MTNEQLEVWKNTINTMTHAELAALRRFAPVGHPVFQTDLPLYELFEARFKALGGMTTKVSKAVGW